LIVIIPVLSTMAAANEPPPAPGIKGPTHGEAGVLYSYGFCSKDPDGDNLTYYVNWGDESNWTTIGPLPPNLCGAATHIWSNQGSFIISAKASDGQAESNWSTLEVTMPKDVSLPRVFFWFFEVFPHAFPMLRYLLGY
jgi:hypothetical protein